MLNSKTSTKVLLLAVLFFNLTFVLTSSALAQEQTNDYLKYQEPPPAANSALSTFTYILSLILTFGLVIGLAYFISKFVGYKFGNQSITGDGKIISTLALGPNRAVHVVDIAGKVMILGVTENSIQLLLEITDAEDIQKLRSGQIAPLPQSFSRIFQQQFTSLQQMSQKFPVVFGREQRPEHEYEQEKR